MGEHKSGTLTGCKKPKGTLLTYRIEEMREKGWHRAEYVTYKHILPSKSGVQSLHAFQPAVLPKLCNKTVTTLLLS